MILTTHDIEDIEELCNRIIIIDEGKKIYDGSLEELKHIFGKTRTVSISVKQVKKLEGFDLAENIGVLEEACCMTIDQANNVLKVTFDKVLVKVVV